MTELHRAMRRVRPALRELHPVKLAGNAYGDDVAHVDGIPPQMRQEPLYTFARPRVPVDAALMVWRSPHQTFQELDTRDDASVILIPFEEIQGKARPGA